MSANNSSRSCGVVQSIHNKRKRPIVADHINVHQDACYNFKIEKQHSANEQFIRWKQLEFLIAYFYCIFLNYRQICELYQQEKLCDVVFVVGNQGCRFKAHRVVLASANK